MPQFCQPLSHLLCLLSTVRPSRQQLPQPSVPAYGRITCTTPHTAYLSQNILLFLALTLRFSIAILCIEYGCQLFFRIVRLYTRIHKLTDKVQRLLNTTLIADKFIISGVRNHTQDVIFPIVIVNASLPWAIFELDVKILTEVVQCFQLLLCRQVWQWLRGIELGVFFGHYAHIWR